MAWGCKPENHPDGHQLCRGGHNANPTRTWQPCVCGCHQPAEPAEPAEVPAATSADPAPPEVTEPGVYDLEEAVYHGDPVPERLGRSLSQSGAKLLLPPSTPAHFLHYREHGRPNRPAYDLGHVVHMLVLGRGAEVAVIDAEDWKTKAAREARDAAYAAGQVPLLTTQHEQAKAMAEAVNTHPVARILFDPDHGRPEVSMFWQDPATGVFQRGRLDWLPNPSPGGRLILPDLKTTISADPGAFGKKAADFGYDIQDAFYTAGAKALALAADVAFLFVLVEKDPPHLVSVVQLDAEATRVGRERARLALDTYAQCQSTGHWPGYSGEVELASLPSWFVYQHESRFAAA